MGQIKIGNFFQDDNVPSTQLAIETDLPVRVDNTPTDDTDVLRKVDGGTIYAPADATYLVVSLDGVLTNERRFQVGTGLQISDGGAGGDITISHDPESDIGALTDSTSGTPGSTISALTDPADTPATADALRDDLVANIIPELRNNLASLTAQVNAIRTALQNLGLMS